MVFVEQIDPRPGNGGTDGNVFPDAADCCADGDLSRAVAIIQACRSCLVQCIQQRLGKRLAGSEDNIHAAHRLFQISKQAGRRTVQDIGIVLCDIAGKRIRIVHTVLVRKYNRHAVKQGGKQLKHGDVKADRTDGDDPPAVSADITVEFVIVRLHEVDDAAVLDHHAFGLAGCTRGIDDIAQPVLADCGQGAVRRLRRVKQRSGSDDRTAGIRDVRVRDQQACFAVRQDEADAFFGIGTVNGNIGCAGLENAEQHHRKRGSARHQKSNIGLRLYTGSDQVACDTVGRLVQFLESIACPLAGQGTPIRVLCRLRAETADNGRFRIDRQYRAGEQRALAELVPVR